MRCLALLFFACSIFVPPAALGDDKPPPASPFGLTKRVPWTTSRIVGSPEPPAPYRLERRFPRIKFQGPVCLAQEPDTNRLLVGENNGKIYSLALDTPDSDRTELFLDIKRSLYAFSFHPRYKENGQIFVFSPTAAEGTPGTSLSRVSRFETGPEYPPPNPPRLRARHHRMAVGGAQRRRGDHRARRISLHRHGRRDERLRRQQLRPGCR